MRTSYNGFDEQVITLQTNDNTLTAGSPVKLTSDGKAAACADGDIFCGFCTSVRDGFAAVQIKGYVRAVCSDVKSCGYTSMAAKTNGVAAAEKGRQYLVLDCSDDSIGFIL